MRTLRLVLPLATVCTVSPKAYGATQLYGPALATPVDDEGARPIEVDEFLYLAPELAAELGFLPTQWRVPWLPKM